jgi:Winged helix DNA-binding domain
MRRTLRAAYERRSGSRERCSGSYRGRVAGDVLSQRTLNRTLLARQSLLERTDAPVLTMVERLVGLQAQVPGNPYIGLWSRLRAFDPAELSELLESRRAVRGGLMRSTIHLVSARDCLLMAPLVAPLRARTFWPGFGDGLRGAEVDEVVAAGREHLAAAPRTRAELSEHLAARWPDSDPIALAHAATFHLPIVQVPPRGMWGRTSQATWALADDWLGAPLVDDPQPDELVLRYLAAFGPATSADVRTWSGITGLRPVLDRLRPGLRSFRDERGRELLDVPDGLIADPDTPAPPRFLPEFDNLTLSHADRSRVLDDRSPDYRRGSVVGTLLVDGFARAAWRVEGDTLTVEGLDSADPAVEAEGIALLEFLAVSDPRVRFVP